MVHARPGPREAYRPLRSRLCRGADPVEVVRALLALAPFRTVYLADLEAIGGSGDNRPTLRRIREAFPRLSLWVDPGITDAVDAVAWLAEDLGTLVLGSETMRDSDLPARLASHVAPRRLVLSLDRDGPGLMAPEGLIDSCEAWPGRVIAMALGRVGAGAGPDLDALAETRPRAGGRPVYSAGGVRDGADLIRLAEAGAAGALVATALHDGSIGTTQIAAIGACGEGLPSASAAQTGGRRKL